MKRKRQFSFNLFSKYRSELMGISAIGILFCHILTNAAEHGITEFSVFSQVTMLGSAYVDAFLFLSGIGLYYSFSRNGSISKFYQKRYIRLLIPYLLVSVPTIIFCCVRDGLGLKEFLVDIAGISFFTEGRTFAWFVIAIAIFYFITPLLYRIIFSGNRALLKAFVVCSGEIIFTFILYQVDFNLFENIDIALMRFPVFLLGMYCGKLCMNNATVRNDIMTLGMFVGGITVLLRLIGKIPVLMAYYANTILGLFFLTVAVIIIDFLNKHRKETANLLTVLKIGGGIRLKYIFAILHPDNFLIAHTSYGNI